MSTHSFKNWTPAIPIKKPDNIVSSEFSSLKVFKPSYEKDTHIPMEQLLANEYQRIWLMERDEWLRKNFSQKTKGYKRRTVQKIPEELIRVQERTKQSTIKKPPSKEKINKSLIIKQKHMN